MSARMLWTLTAVAPDLRPLLSRDCNHVFLVTVQGLTNPDGTLKTECGIHSVR